LSAARIFLAKIRQNPGAGPGFYEQLFGLWPGAAANPNLKPDPAAARNPKKPEQFPNHPGAARTPGKKNGPQRSAAARFTRTI